MKTELVYSMTQAFEGHAQQTEHSRLFVNITRHIAALQVTVLFTLTPFIYKLLQFMINNRIALFFAKDCINFSP